MTKEITIVFQKININTKLSSKVTSGTLLLENQITLFEQDEVALKQNVSLNAFAIKRYNRKYRRRVVSIFKIIFHFRL